MGESTYRPVPCSFPGCKCVARTRLKYCYSHTKQQKAGVELRPLIPRQVNKGKTCRLSGCMGKALSLGLCSTRGTLYREAVASGQAELGLWKREIRKRVRGTVQMSIRVRPEILAILKEKSKETNLSLGAVLIGFAMPMIERTTKPKLLRPAAAAWAQGQRYNPLEG